MRLFIIAISLLWAAPSSAQDAVCKNPATFCGAQIAANCLERHSAGAIPVGDDCKRQMNAYRDCLQIMAQQCGGPTSADCGEQTARELWHDARSAHDCLGYEGFISACPGTPQARMAEAQIRRLQCSAANAPDRHVTPAVSAQKLTRESVSPALSWAERPENIRAAQRELRRLGYYSGATNGDWGPSSQGAMRAFQRSEGLAIDDVLTEAGLTALRATETLEPVRCGVCPEMVALPGGVYTRGSPDRDGASDEHPQHRVSIKPFEIGKYEVTFKQWDACFADGYCRNVPRGRASDDYTDRGWGRGPLPVIEISWYDIHGKTGNNERGFLAWMEFKTGLEYRLPTEAEWEYAARAGSTELYPWGPLASHEYANYGADKCCKGLSSGRDQ